MSFYAYSLECSANSTTIAQVVIDPFEPEDVTTPDRSNVASPRLRVAGQDHRITEGFAG